MADKNKNNYLWIGIAVVAVVVLAIVFISNSNNNSLNENQNKVEYANYIEDVKLEFIPSQITGVECEAGESCVINFQVKNIGDKRIHVAPGTFEDDADLEGITYLGVGSRNSAYLAPGETSQTLGVNAFASFNLDEGNYQIKIPLQAYDESGNRIGESMYYLTGSVYYSNLPYCCSEQQIEKGYCDKVATNNCRSLSCEETNNLPPCYG
jgi:hypothetical protein